MPQFAAFFAPPRQSAGIRAEGEPDWLGRQEMNRKNVARLSHGKYAQIFAWVDPETSLREAFFNVVQLFL
jgi:hypothetical protein